MHRLRPGELADLLEDLRRDERQDLLAALSADEAADALEEMQPDDLEQLLREFKPEIVLTDLVMPDVSGHVVVQTLKDSMSFEKIPIILFSAQPEAELAIVAEAVGADGYVSKEGGTQLLGEKIDQLIEEIIW